MTRINEFQVRFQFTDADGRLTLEASRFLRDWFNRIGGSNGIDVEGLDVLASYTAPQDNGTQIDELRARLDEMQGVRAELASLRQRVEANENVATFQDPYRVNWERPGKIGSLTANTGAFTALTATTFNKVTITAPATAATLALADNSSLSTVGAFAAVLTFTAGTGVTFPVTGTLATLAGAEALTNKTYNGNSWTAGTGTLAVAAGKTFTASNTLTVTATDGSTLAIGSGGTLGTAAYTSSGAYAPLAGSAGQNFSANTLTAAGAFGCNGATAQAAYASGGALAAYGAGANGFDTAGHASALYAMVVAIRAALVANGTMS